MSSESSTEEEVSQYRSDEETEVSSLPSFVPPAGWKKLQTSEVSKFDIVDIQNDENEIWLLKIPSRVTRADLSGKTFKLSTEGAEVPTKVAKLQKNIQETTFASFKKRTVDTTATYGVYEMPTGKLKSQGEKDDEFTKGMASHQAILDKMQEFELLMPNKSSNGSLFLSSKKPDRYFNICREIEQPDLTQNIDSTLLKKPDVQHPPESFVPRSAATVPEFSKEHMDKAYLENKKFRQKLIEDEEFLTTTDEEVPVTPTKKRTNESKYGKGHKKILKSQYFTNLYSSDDEILAEVAEEEAEFAKMAQEQIRLKETITKSLEDAERQAFETWIPSLVTCPKFEPPVTWWSKMSERIIAEEEEKKLKPYAIKRDWSVEERMEYYKKYMCEPPPYPVPKPKGWASGSCDLTANRTPFFSKKRKRFNNQGPGGGSHFGNEHGVERCRLSNRELNNFHVPVENVEDQYENEEDLEYQVNDYEMHSQDADIGGYPESTYPMNTMEPEDQDVSAIPKQEYHDSDDW
ncbi:6659_t:CDS:2 [Acaulospora colombiana]|uniref:6659_t:CDS:1 n=1 Tax=Acaulospora colombiana TaxID=27376 RepID=A0ACA9KX79_9GLOM|nr:6659_t:CDS:2 [Acaulospora colombiana]